MELCFQFPWIDGADGRLTLHAWGLLSILKPHVVVMEMVSGTREHQHWKLIRSFILWCGFSIRWARTMNLAELSPQQRSRLILVATLDHAELMPHICVPWPVTQRQTMESYLSIMELEEPWLSQCTLAPEVLQVYMDSAMLPKPVEQSGRDVKRARKDIEEYRVKHPHSDVLWGSMHTVTCCLMLHSVRQVFWNVDRSSIWPSISECSRDSHVADDSHALLVARQPSCLHQNACKLHRYPSRDGGFDARAGPLV